MPTLGGGGGGHLPPLIFDNGFFGGTITAGFRLHEALSQLIIWGPSKASSMQNFHLEQNSRPGGGGNFHLEQVMG